MAPITHEELSRSINKMQRNNAGGTDKLCNDFFLDFKAEVSSWLLQVYNDILNKQQMPKAFREAKIITIPKGGDEEDAMNYRPIALLQTPYKIFTRIIAERLRGVLAQLVRESQHGFLPDRQLEDAVNTVQALLTKRYKTRKEPAAESPILLAIDYAKAYDSLKRSFLWDTMEKFGFGKQFINLIKEIHYETTVRFEVNGTITHPFQMTVGIRQGCPLAPLLFILGIEPLTRLIEQDLNPLVITLGKTTIFQLFYLLLSYQK